MSEATYTPSCPSCGMAPGYCRAWCTAAPVTGPAVPPGGEEHDVNLLRGDDETAGQSRRQAPGGEELREAIVRTLAHHSWCTYGQPMVSVTGAVESRGQCNCLSARQQDADALLALPAVRDALAAQEAVRRCEALAEEWIDSSPLGLSALAGAGRALRHALAGEPT